MFLGQVPRQAPSEQWGGGDPHRGGTAISWSNEVVVAAQGAPVVGQLPQAFGILKFVSPTGMPALWNVSIALRAAPGSGSPLRANVWGLLGWSAGRLRSSAEFDIVGGNACFQISADSIDVGIFNQYAPPNNDVLASIAITHAGSAVAAARTARRTLSNSGAPGAVVLVPAWAQQVQPNPTTNVPAAFSFDIRDATGAILQTVYIDTALAPDYPLVELPNGAFDIHVLTSVAPKFATFMFVLGF